MKKNIFLSRNRRCINISTKKRGRKSKRGKRGKNSKMSKMSKRVKTVNTNMRKNRTKKGRRNVQKGGVWVEITQQNKTTGGRETIFYDVNEANKAQVNDFNNPSKIQDPARTWRKHKDPTSGRDFYVNDSTGQSVWEEPSPNPAFEPGYVSHAHTVTQSPHASVSTLQQYQQPHGSVTPSHSTTQEEELSSISALLFQPTIESNPNDFVVKLHGFKVAYPTFDISKEFFQINGRSQTILYAACRTQYVSLDILKSLTTVFRCSPAVRTSDGFYPLGALISSLNDNVKSRQHDDIRVLVDKYIKAIQIFITFISNIKTLPSPALIENKNGNGLTAYDDFAQFSLYNYIDDCSQLNKICELLLKKDGDSKRQRATVLFEACSKDNIYPDLIRRLIECRNNVNTKSIILYADIDTGNLRQDDENSGYPITALIKSYNRIKSAGGNVTDCTAAIGIVYRDTQHVDIAKIESEYPGTTNTAKEILTT